MNFIKELIKVGFVEQGQKRLLELMPKQARWIPNWWEDYPFDRDWFGVSVDHPDAWFTKEGFNGEVVLSLNGTSIGYPKQESDKLLMDSRSARYIKLKVGQIIFYETFSGKTPSEDTLKEFISLACK